jgi:hypothetical protein
VHHGHGGGEIRVNLIGRGRDPRLPARAWACLVSRAHRGGGCTRDGRGKGRVGAGARYALWRDWERQIGRLGGVDHESSEAAAW